MICYLLAWLNTAGLVLGMVGVFIIFVWGPPQPSFQHGTPLLIDREDWKERDAEVEQKRRLYKKRSASGLVLIGIGFACQLISSFPLIQCR